MTIAQKFYKEYTNVSYDYELNRKNWVEWETLMDKIREDAIEETEQGNGSWDPSIIYRFSDGSSLYVGNPTQGAFDGFMYVES